jgi:hypothetical protein
MLCDNIEELKSGFRQHRFIVDPSAYAVIENASYPFLSAESKAKLDFVVSDASCADAIDRGLITVVFDASRDAIFLELADAESVSSFVKLYTVLYPRKGVQPRLKASAAALTNRELDFLPPEHIEFPPESSGWRYDDYKLALWMRQLWVPQGHSPLFQIPVSLEPELLEGFRAGRLIISPDGSRVVQNPSAPKDASEVAIYRARLINDDHVAYGLERGLLSVVRSVRAGVVEEMPRLSVIPLNMPAIQALVDKYHAFEELDQMPRPRPGMEKEFQEHPAFRSENGDTFLYWDERTMVAPPGAEGWDAEEWSFTLFWLLNYSQKLLAARRLAAIEDMEAQANAAKARNASL